VPNSGKISFDQLHSAKLFISFLSTTISPSFLLIIFNYPTASQLLLIVLFQQCDVSRRPTAYSKLPFHSETKFQRLAQTQFQATFLLRDKVLHYLSCETKFQVIFETKFYITFLFSRQSSTLPFYFRDKVLHYLSTFETKLHITFLPQDKVLHLSTSRQSSFYTSYIRLSFID
jgi:hypothetical protein